MSKVETSLFRRKLRKRIIDVLKDSEIFKRVFDSRVSDLDPKTDRFPVATVYAQGENNDVQYQRDTMNTIKESEISLDIQIINTLTAENVDHWPDAVEGLEAATLDYLRALDNERKIDECIKWITLADSQISIDVEGEVPVVSVVLTFMVRYNQKLAFEALEDFDRVAYKLDYQGNDIEVGPFEVSDDQES